MKFEDFNVFWPNCANFLRLNGSFWQRTQRPV